jgi:hypothetical protein
LIAAAIGIPAGIAVGWIAAPLIASTVVLIVGSRIAGGLIAGSISYIIPQLIKSETWIARTKIYKYTTN